MADFPPSKRVGDMAKSGSAAQQMGLAGRGTVGDRMRAMGRSRDGDIPLGPARKPMAKGPSLSRKVGR